MVPCIHIAVRVARLRREVRNLNLHRDRNWSLAAALCDEQTLHQILVKMQVGKEGGVGEKGPCSSGGNKAGKRAVSERRRSAEGRRKQANIHLNSEKPSDSAEEEAEVMLWSNDARDIVTNLAGVFNKEGGEEATRKAAAAIARRIEVMSRCYAVLRVSLQDIIEGKVGVMFGLGCFLGVMWMFEREEMFVMSLRNCTF